MSNKDIRLMHGKIINAIIDYEFSLPEVGRFPQWRHKEAWRGFEISDKTDLVGRLDYYLGRYYNTLGDYDFRSKANWRFEKKKHLNPINPSDEKKLEKAFIKACDEKTWANQVPVCSGIPLPYDKVDWVRKLGQNHFEFIELKVESNHPHYAAIEIIIYGLLYRVWVMKNGFSTVAIKAKKIDLKVLAPESFYRLEDISDLIGFQKFINHNLEQLETPKFSFAFEFFSDSTIGLDDPTQIVANINNRKSLDTLL